jgi:hypothetical protein
MKMMKIQSFLMAFTLSVLLFACKKSTNDTNSTPSNTDLQTQSDDQSRVSTETDAAFNDVNASMTGQFTVTGSSTGKFGVTVEGGNQDTVKSYVCDATVTIDTVDNPRTLTIIYNGANCHLTRTRTGKVVVSWAKGVAWHTAGAVVTVNFDSLKITRLGDGKSITLNGTHTYTNVSGGSLLSLTSNSASPITHTIMSTNMSVTFDNGTQRTWSVARQRIYGYNNGLVITTSGLHTSGSIQGISEWGTNRFGNSFTTQIVTPMVISLCNSTFQVTSGAVGLTNAAGSTMITFGLDSTGAATGCPVGSASYYFKLVWTGAAGKTYTFVLPY